MLCMPRLSHLSNLKEGGIVGNKHVSTMSIIYDVSGFFVFNATLISLQ